MVELLGNTLGRCRIVGKLGRGGMGDIYIGEHTGLQKRVIIKVLAPELTRDNSYIMRFRREALLIARLEHPNIVQIFDVGEESGVHFIVLQYVQGKSLAELIAPQRKLSVEASLRIARDVARGLACAHENQIIHRDIKPDNILIPEEGPAKIADFGISLDETSHTGLTATGRLIGTPKYISPEQAKGERATAASDIYSLGVTLYVMLTGRELFSGVNAPSILHKHVYERVLPPSMIVSDLPQAVNDLVVKCLEKNPRRRPPSAKSLAESIDRLLRMPQALKKPKSNGLARSVTPVRRAPRPWVLYGSAALSVLIVAVVVVLTMNASGTAREAPSTERKPTEFEDLVQRAQAAEAKEDFDAAFALYQNARRLQDTAELARAAERLKVRLQELKAKASIPVASAPSPEALAHFQVGKEKLGRQEYAGALVEFEKAAELSSPFPEACFQQATCKFYLGKFAEALDAINVAMAQGMRDLQTFLLRSALYLELGKLKEGIADADAAISLDNKQWGGWHNRGVGYFRLEEFAKAAADLTRAIEIQDQAVTRYMRAKTYLKLRDYRSALSDARRAKPNVDSMKQSELALLAQECEKALGEDARTEAARLLEEARGHLKAKMTARARSLLLKILVELPDTPVAGDAGAELALLFRDEPWTVPPVARDLQPAFLLRSGESRVAFEKGVLTVRDDPNDGLLTTLFFGGVEAREIAGYLVEFRVTEAKSDLAQVALVAGHVDPRNQILFVALKASAEVVAYRGGKTNRDAVVPLAGPLSDWHRLMVVSEAERWWFFVDDRLVMSRTAIAFQPDRDGVGIGNSVAEIRRMAFKSARP